MFGASMFWRSNREPSPGAIRDAVERILSSDLLKGSERLSRLLRFVVDETLAGRSAELKESVLGVEVFDRGADFDSRTDPVVRVSAGRLRAKLAEYYASAQDPVVIELPKGGYVPVFRSQERSASKWGSAWKVAAACGTLLVLGAAFLLSRDKPSSVPGLRSIAVLPFVNMSQDPEGEYFSDGLTEELIDSLARSEALRVTARTSAFQFKGKARDIREICRLLNVDAIVEGSVRKQGERIRITAQLNKAKDGFHIWSQSYDVTIADSLRTQQEIARSIGAALQIHLTNQPVKRSVNPKAWQAYLRGNHFRNRMIPDASERIRAGYHEAIALDPNFAEAHAALARQYVAMGRVGLLKPRDALAMANASVTRSLSIDGNLVDALLTVCLIKSEFEWDWPGAEQACLRALALAPGSMVAHSMQGRSLAAASRLKEAIEEDSRAVELDPLSLDALTNLARHLYLARRYTEAVEQAKRMLYLDNKSTEGLVVLGLVALQQGKHAEAISHFQEMIVASGGRENPNQHAVLGHAYAISGNRVEALRLLRGLEERAKVKPTTSTLAARIYLGLGDYDRALDLLENAYDERDWWLLFLLPDPRTDPIRSHPRFVKLVQKMNFPLPGSG